MKKTVLFLLFWVFCVVSISNAEVFTLKRVDNFIFLIDYSGSMMMKSANGKTNIDLVKTAIKNINDEIPECLSFKFGISTIAPVNKSIVYDSWNKEKVENYLASLRNDYEIFGRMSPLNNNIKSLTSDGENILNKNSKKTAVILITDGEFNLGKSPLNAVEEITSQNLNVIFHVISLATNNKSTNVLHKICSLDKDSIFIDINELQDTSKAKNFVFNVFCGNVSVNPVYFEFDKFNVKSDYIKDISELMDNLNKNFIYDSINIIGWTDHVGTDKYNYKLSLRRADSVANEIHKFMSYGQIISEGQGKSFMYDNTTSDGRAKNRRANVYLK